MSNTSRTKIGQFDAEATDLILDDSIRSRFTCLIGEFLILFSLLEGYLNSYILTHIYDDSDQVGLVFVRSMNFGQKLEAAKQITKIKFSAQPAKQEVISLELIARVREIQLARNKIVHAEWNTLDENGFVRIKYAVNSDTGYTRSQREKLNEEKIQTFILEINEIIKELDELDCF